jgi:hypothetical protein
MLKAYVGVASQHGLAILQPERDDTLCLVERCVQTGASRVGFWAVLGDADADAVQTLFQNGYRREALAMLDRCAKDMGRILPSDRQLSTLH